MTRILAGLVLTLILLLAAGPALAQEAAPASDSFSTENVEARLMPEFNGIAPGGTLTIALRQKIRPKWHTYWTYAGDSGEATGIDWFLPDGWSASELAYPWPERIPVGPLVNYGYEGTVLLLATLTAPADAVPGETVRLRANAHWLVCEEICIPEEASFALDVAVMAAPEVNGLFASEIAATRAKLPQESPWPVRFALDGTDLVLTLSAPALGVAPPKEIIFFQSAGGYVVNASPQTVSHGPVGISLRITAGRRFATPEKAAGVSEVPGLFVITDQDGKTLSFDVAAMPGALPAHAAIAPVASGDEIALWEAFLYALLGGLILNLMPCVFPVLSMKALALARKGAHAPEHAAAGGLAYTAGVVISFVAIAGALIALRSAGDELGWGFQLQSPALVAGLGVLFFLIGLNLMGVFEIAGGFQGAGNSLTARSGLSGSFFTGVLAALVATPCTAPFMAAAIGFAMTQPSAVALAIFAALGLGMALPYLLLTLSPALVRRLPKPGPWMERFKQVLAFPMFGSAVWLIWVLSVQAGSPGVLGVLVACVAFAFAAWLWGLVQTGAARRAFVIVALIASGLGVWAIAAIPAGAGQGIVIGENDTIPSEPYSEERLATLRAENRIVFVNLTAAWCITCLVNEEVALSSQAMVDEFRRLGVVYLKGDWTNRDPVITRVLERYGRAGVPLYLVFRPGVAAPEVLPQILTESIVLEALQRTN